MDFYGNFTEAYRENPDIYRGKWGSSCACPVYT